MAPITFIYPSSMAPGAPASRHGLQQTAPMLPKELTGCSSRHLHRAARTAHPQPLQAGSSLQQYRNALGKARIAQAGQGPVQPREGQEDPALLQGCDIPTCPCWARCSVPAALHRSCSTAWSCPGAAGNAPQHQQSSSETPTTHHSHSLGKLRAQQSKVTRTHTADQKYLCKCLCEAGAALGLLTSCQ